MLIDPARWREAFEVVMDRVAGRFAWAAPRRRARRLVLGLAPPLLPTRATYWNKTVKCSATDPDGRETPTRMCNGELQLCVASLRNAAQAGGGEGELRAVGELQVADMDGVGAGGDLYAVATFVPLYVDLSQATATSMQHPPSVPL